MIRHTKWQRHKHQSTKMSYPFTNPQYAQSGNYGHQPQQSYGSSAARFDYDNDHAYNGYGNGAGRDGYGHEMQEAPSHRDFDEGPPSLPEKDVDGQKMYNEGSSPYGPAAMADPIYTGKTIWSRDDKSAMAKRGVPAKLFRVLFCLIINAIIVIVSIICLVIIFARPFNVGVGSMSMPSSSSVGISGTAITFNGSVDFIVSNPNSISSELTLTAKVYDQADKSQDIGRGSVSGSKIDANANSTIKFPYQVRYDPAADKSKAILKDLVQKCGLTGGAKQQLDLTLNIDAHLKILSVPVPVSFSQDISFDCPLSADMLKGIGGGDLLNIASGLGSRALHDWAADRDVL